jgi:putative IMPACT (imprinted ancient) family translation regulator
MMDILEGSGVTNCLVVVTRYFGGTLLGTGGLVKAYSSAAKLAIENAGLTEVEAGVRCRIEADYNSLGKLQYLLASLDVPVLDTLYEQNVVLDLVVADDTLGKLEKRLQDDFAGRLALERGDSVQFYRSEGSAIVL